MANILEQVWEERSTVNSQGERVPTFWQPQSIPAPHREFDPWEVGLIARLCAVGLSLELPVGDLLSRQMARIPGLQMGVAEKVLKAAVSDEGRHYRGFRYLEDWLREYYGQTPDTGAIDQFLAELGALPYAPVTQAALLEVTLFLPFLGLLRVVGGNTLSPLALGINEDEQRHTRVNASLSAALGDPIPTCTRFNSLREGVLDWVLQGVPKDTAELVRKSSVELYQNLDSPSLNNLQGIAAVQFKAPFEVSNAEMYARVTE